MYNLIGILAIFVLSSTILTFAIAIGAYAHFRIKYAKDLNVSTRNRIYYAKSAAEAAGKIIAEQKCAEDLEQEQRNNTIRIRNQIKWY